MNLDTFFAHWDKVRDGLLLTIDKFDQTELRFVPFQGSWPAGQIMLHIADAEEGWFRTVVTGERAEWPADYTLDNYSTKASIEALLTGVHNRTKAYLATLSLADLDRPVASPWDDYTFSLGWIIWHVLEHEIHHRAELSLILGLLGREGLDV